MRLVMKALRALFAFFQSVYQKPIRRKEASPTPSQPTNITG